MSDGLKDKFIFYYGKKKWNQEELLGKLIDYQLDICEVLGIECVPVVFEDGLEDDSRLYIKDMYIALSDKIETLIDGVKCLVHECKHIEQMMRAMNPKTIQEQRWKACFDKSFTVNNYDSEEELTRYALQEIEIDAYAFTQVYIKEMFGIDTFYPNKTYQFIIDIYKKEYYE